MSWQVPAYSFPKNLEDMSVLRIVVRNGFSMVWLHQGDLLASALSVPSTFKRARASASRDPGGAL